MEDVEKILSEYSSISLKHYKQIKRYIFYTWIYLILVSGIFAFGLMNVSESNHDLAEIINKRSPVLDYLRCHDDLEDNKSIAQTELLLSYIDSRDNPSEASQIKLAEVRLTYEKAAKALENPDSCPDFPSKLF